MCEVINIRDRKPGDVYIGRAGHGENGYFGNPHPVGRKCSICNVIHTRAEAIKAFKVTFWERVHNDPEYLRRILGLKNKRITCFCKPKACHGDVIVAFHEWLEIAEGKKWLSEHPLM